MATENNIPLNELEAGGGDLGADKGSRGARDLDGRDLVLRAVCCPVRVFGGHDICAAYRVVESGVNHPGCHALAHMRMQDGRSNPARHRDLVAVTNAA